MEIQDAGPSLKLGYEVGRGHRILRAAFTTVSSLEQLQRITPTLTAISLAKKRKNRNLDVTDGVGRVAHGKFFASVLHIATPCSVPKAIDTRAFTCIRALVVNSGGMTPERFACLFSALPHTRSLISLDLEPSDRQITWPFTELELRWIAYAIFHPQTQFASWRKLVLGSCTLDAGAIRVLESMASDSKSALLSVTALATLMNVEHSRKRKREDDSEDKTKRDNESEARAPQQPLRLVRVQQGTVVRERPGARVNPIATVVAEGEFEVCNAPAPSSSSSKLWRCVLVPGYGFGWIHKRDVIDETDWSAAVTADSASPLTSLALGSRIAKQVSLKFVTALGASLETLVFKTGSKLDTITDTLAQLCPRLRALQVHSERGPFAPGTLERYFSQPTAYRLQSLTLNWEACGTTSGLWEILSDPKTYPAVMSLQELRISSAIDADPVVAMLHANKMLACVRIDEVPRESERLMQFDGQALSHTHLVVPLLSALTQRSRQREGGSDVCDAILGSRDVLLLVCAFVSVLPRRVVHIGRPYAGSSLCCRALHGEQWRR